MRAIIAIAALAAISQAKRITRKDDTAQARFAMYDVDMDGYFDVDDYIDYMSSVVGYDIESKYSEAEVLEGRMQMQKWIDSLD